MVPSERFLSFFGGSTKANPGIDFLLSTAKRELQSALTLAEVDFGFGDLYSLCTLLFIGVVENAARRLERHLVDVVPSRCGKSTVFCVTQWWRLRKSF